MRDVADPHRQETNHEERVSLRPVMLVAVALLIGVLSCSPAPRSRLARLQKLSRQIEDQVLAVRPRDPRLATYTPWPTFTPTSLLPPTGTPTFIPSAVPAPTDTVVPTSTPVPLPTDTFLPSPTVMPSSTSIALPTATPRPAPVVAVAPTPVPRPPTAAPTPVPTAAPSYAYLANDVYIDYTTVPFLTGYIAIVNAQEIPIGGVKAVGVFEPGGTRYETPLSKWFFDVATAPGAVARNGSVKFEPGGIQAGTWYVHLENEQGDRLSEDVGINTNPEDPQWFYIKFKQPGSPGSRVASPTPYRAAVTSTPFQGATSAAGSTPTRAPTATSGAPTGGWSFENVQIISYPEDEMVAVYADMVNRTGASQQIDYVTGTLYDVQGQTLPEEYEMYDYWLLEIVPAGGRAPLELTIYDLQELGSVDLSVISQPSSEAPRQDFDISGVEARDAGEDYCVAGSVHNPGGQLEEYLVVASILYNDQDQIINFDSDATRSPEDVVGDQAFDFEVCVDKLDRDVARYEVRAWGQ